MPFTLTATLVLSDTEAYLARTGDRAVTGPNGEVRVAEVVHTTDQGRTWRSVSWDRTLLSRIRHPGFPTWPPESVAGMHLRDGQLVITHRDEWVPYEPGGESLWESTFDGCEWRTARLRCLDYKGSEPVPPPRTEPPPELPPGFTPPP